MGRAIFLFKWTILIGLDFFSNILPNPRNSTDTIPDKKQVPTESVNPLI